MNLRSRKAVHITHLYSNVDTTYKVLHFKTRKKQSISISIHWAMCSRKNIGGLQMLEVHSKCFN